MKAKELCERCHNIQVATTGSYQGERGGGRRKGPDSGCTLEVEPTGFPPEYGVRKKREESGL